MQAREAFLGSDPDDDRLLCVVFLRGGADGLSLVPPVGDDDYHRARPALAVAARDALPLLGSWSLHPCLAPLLPYFREGQLAIVPACGSEDDTRSHFEAQDLMEHGGRVVSGGWLGRHLRARSDATGPLAAIAIGSRIPESLRGSPSVTALRGIEDAALPEEAAALVPAMARLYDEDDSLGRAARASLAALSRLEKLREADYRPEHGASYASDDFSRALRLVAQLAKAGVGLDAACVDLGNWDSHVLQVTLMEPLMRRLAAGLSAFATDMGPRLSRTSVVVMSEFGRRVRENSALGTDHGRGGVMMILGGGVKGGIHGAFPGLSDAALETPGDVAVATNYRDALWPVLARHAGAPLLPDVFPGHDPAPLSL